MAAPHPTHEKLWTPANIVTFLRICGVPLFVIAIISPWPAWFPEWHDAEVWKSWIAAGIFILLAATDGLDGYLARSRGEVTNLGKFMDPLADKILVAAALLALIELGVLPSWVALVILCREFIVSGIRMVAASQGVVIAASWYGKAKTVTQIIAIVLFIIKDSEQITTFSQVFSNHLYLISWLVMLVAVILTIVSMLDYFVKAREILGFTKSSRKAKGEAGRAPQNASGEEGEAFRELTAEEAASIEPAALEALAKDVLAKAREADLTIGTAESCTGGLIAATLTAVPGSSETVAGGIVSYSNDVKRAELDVRRETLEVAGAVSSQTAEQMADGARKHLGVDIAVSVTGIAGPGGAVEGKPVGTVWIGLSDAAITVSKLHRFPGDREQVRLLSVRAALEFVREAIAGRCASRTL
ncbi:CDP-diacylglycerol--glycerol-3-phosphate 3-phosphatidyltransferase [Raoultibacter phocaeensis]|uniref:CDP-diacylglycerol--glycerol-3-phosphate 3-phosphatidyltransferase n=1 Tax=Raoultibacter phocaeensis TaxID=2479841 RepID=UPI00111AD144|nr:CDP-diacylglycerol--glycerol-3-phosphate 3-phosphatidyltransferase [Raoultibacter phocaeensis]